MLKYIKVLILLIIVLLSLEFGASSDDIDLCVNEICLQFNVIDTNGYIASNYDFVDGEIVDVVCDRHEHGEIQLEYFNSSGFSLLSAQIKSQSGYSKYSLFRSIMYSTRNKSYLVIKYIPRGSESIAYRITFTITQQHFETSSVRVNGMKLFPLHKPNSLSYVSNKFQYFTGATEQINLECAPKGNYKSTHSTETESKNISTFVMDQTTRRTCRNGANITFISETEVLNIRVKGLPLKNILYEHMDTAEYRSIWIVHYQYEHNEKLNISCVSVWGDFEWRYKGKQMTGFSGKVAEMNAKFIQIIFYPNALDNGHNLTCYYMSNPYVLDSITIKLHLKPAQNAEASKLPLAGSPKLVESEVELPMGWIIGGAVTVPNVLLFTASIVICWGRYKRLATNYQNVESQDAVTEDNDVARNYPLAERRERVTNDYQNIEVLVARNPKMKPENPSKLNNFDRPLRIRAPGEQETNFPKLAKRPNADAPDSTEDNDVARNYPLPERRERETNDYQNIEVLAASNPKMKPENPSKLKDCDRPIIICTPNRHQLVEYHIYEYPQVPTTDPETLRTCSCQLNGDYYSYADYYG